MAPGPSRRTVAASYDLEMKAMKIDWEKILGADKPELQVQQYQALCPVAPNSDARWTAEDEQALQQEWQNDPKANHINHFDFNTKAVELKALWKIFPRMYRCLPTDLISPEYGLRFDETTNDNLPGSIQNPIWAPKFCAALKMFSLHVFWHYSREHDFPLMAIVLKYAFMSRTLDCRKWPSITNPIDSSFLDRFLAARNSPDMQDCTLLEVHDKVAAELQGKRPSDLSLIFRGIEKYVEKHGSSTVQKTIEPAPLVQLLRTKDVEAAVAGLEAVNSKGHFSAAHWALMCTKTRESTQEPPRTTDLLSRVFASGYLNGLRWERILASPLPSVPVHDSFHDDEGVLVAGDDDQDMEGGIMPMNDMAADLGDSPEDIYSASDEPIAGDDNQDMEGGIVSMNDLAADPGDSPEDIYSAGDETAPALAEDMVIDIPDDIYSADDAPPPALSPMKNMATDTSNDIHMAGDDSNLVKAVVDTTEDLPADTAGVPKLNEGYQTESTISARSTGSPVDADLGAPTITGDDENMSDAPAPSISPDRVTSPASPRDQRQNTGASTPDWSNPSWKIQRENNPLRLEPSSKRPAHWEDSYKQQTPRVQYPTPYTSSLNADNTGVNAAIMLIRTLVCCPPQRHDDLQSIVSNGEPLLKYACMNVGQPGTDGYHLEELRSYVEKSMVPITGGLSFYNLTKDNGILQDLWKSENLHLFSDLWITRIDSDLRLLPLSDQPTVERAEHKGMSIPELLAQESLIQWDGNRHLNDTITSDYLVTLSNNYPLFWEPVCVRVQYTPNHDRCPGFTDLMANPLRIPSMFTLQREGQDGRLFARKDGYFVDYRLALVIRLRSSDEHGCREDYARLYSPDGQYIQPHWTAGGVMPPCVSDEWRLGEPGHSYMLYFVKSNVPILDVDQLREVAELPVRHIDAPTLVIETIVNQIHPKFWRLDSLPCDLNESITVRADLLKHQRMKMIDEACKTFNNEFSFLANTENQKMWGLFWGRKHLRFTKGYVATRIQVDTNLGPLVTISEDTTKARAKSLGMKVAEMLAMESLLKWDGTVDLDFAINEYLDTTINNRGQPSWPLPNFPLCIRVLYTPKKEASPGFQEIMAHPLQFGDISEPSTHSDGGITMDFFDFSLSYRLVAVVRLRSDKAGENEDRVRVYKTSGEFVKPVGGPHPYVCNEWRLGEPGASYILYFVGSNDEMIDNPQEVGRQ